MSRPRVVSQVDEFSRRAAGNGADDLAQTGLVAERRDLPEGLPSLQETGPIRQIYLLVQIQGSIDHLARCRNLT